MEHDETIKRLKAAREDINAIASMFSRAMGYQESIRDAKEKIDEALYELTGDEFYRKEGGGGQG